MKGLLLATSVLALTAPLSALAQNAAQDQADARCFLALRSEANSASPAAQSPIRSLMMYYFGKLSGRNSPAAMAEALNAAQRDMAPNEYQEIVVRCGSEAEKLAKLLSDS